MRDWVRVSIVGIALGGLGACSEGATGGTFPGLPPPGPPSPATSTSGEPATFGMDDGPGDCCVANGTPGCDQLFIEACVCAEAPECCGDEWTSRCAGMVEELNCGPCGPPDTGPEPDSSGGPPGGQDCCGSGSEPGCNDPEIEACVCAEIGFCCDTGWDKVCASAVEALHCGHCGGVGETGDPPPPPGGSSGGETGDPPPPPPPMGGCCEVQETPGCTDAAVQDCVCAQDDYCCATAWDQICVDEVDSFMCGDCGGGMPPPGTSPCCEAQMVMVSGCGDAAIEACVCAIDDYCCTVEWDSACAAFVELFLCGSCS